MLPVLNALLGLAAGGAVTVWGVLLRRIAARDRTLARAAERMPRGGSHDAG